MVNPENGRLVHYMLTCIRDISKAAEAGTSSLKQQFDLDRDAPLLLCTSHGPPTSPQPRAEKNR
jgi:hypothetical protein